jgi:hypothetical protein
VSDDNGQVKFIGRGGKDHHAAVGWTAELADRPTTRGFIITAIEQDGSIEQRAFGVVKRNEFAASGADLLHFETTGEFE